MQGGGLDQPRPAVEGALVGDGFKVHPAKLAQHQTIRDELAGLGKAPVVEVLDDEHAQDDLHGRRGPSVGRRMRVAAQQIGFDGLKKGVIVE